MARVPEGRLQLAFELKPVETILDRARSLAEELRARRSVRDFSERQIPRAVIEDAIRAAGSAPCGANQQPWHFVAVSDPIIKRQIREAAEAEERSFYEHRAPDEWLNALAPLGTDAEKPFLEHAPYLIVIFAEAYGLKNDGSRVKHYYVAESVGIATGFLIATLHLAGLATLTHTPSPMGFLREILGRPTRERPFLILVVGYPEEGATVPAIEKKTLTEIATFLD